MNIILIFKVQKVVERPPLGHHMVIKQTKCLLNIDF